MDEKQITVKIPKELENLKLPSPELIDYYKDLNERKIYIDYEITEDLIEVGKQIIRYNIADKDIPIKQRKPIIIYIFSSGGELQITYSIIAIMQTSKTPIYTVNLGMSYSAGLLLLLAGNKRFALKRSQALIHTGSGGFQGTYEQMEENQKAYKKIINDMKEYILSQTKIDEKLFNKNKTKDWYLSDDDQVKLGIVDKIVNDISEII